MTAGFVERHQPQPVAPLVVREHDRAPGWSREHVSRTDACQRPLD